MRIVFMGTPHLAGVVFSKLINSEHDIILAVTQPDRKGNRGKVIPSPVKALAVEHGIPVSQPERIRKDPEFIDMLRGLAPDMIVVAAFGQILPQEVLDIPKYGCINVHASLLPKYRGASPMHHAILDGEECSGVTIMRMEAGLDTGDMISSRSVSITGMDILELTDILAEIGGDLLLETIGPIADGTAVYTPQDDSLSSYAPMINKADGLTCFECDAVSEERKIRAYLEWPTLHSYIGDKLVKFYAADVVDPGVFCGEAGTVAEVNKDNFIVNCSSGQLVIKELQIQGKKRMPAADFLRGYRLSAGDRFTAEPAV